MGIIVNWPFSIKAYWMCRIYREFFETIHFDHHHWWKKFPHLKERKRKEVGVRVYTTAIDAANCEPKREWARAQWNVKSKLNSEQRKHRKYFNIYINNIDQVNLSNYIKNKRNRKWCEQIKTHTHRESEREIQNGQNNQPNAFFCHCAIRAIIKIKKKANELNCVKSELVLCETDLYTSLVGAKSLM